MRKNWIVLLALAAAPLLLGSANPRPKPVEKVPEKDVAEVARQTEGKGERQVEEKQAETADAEAVRFDGVYQTEQADYFSYLRLYPDGTAITLSTREPPEALNHWFNRNCVGLPRGTYTIQSERIDFTVQAKRGSVEYVGKLVGNDRIDFHVRSLMNGSESDLSYRFVPIDSLSEELSDAVPDSCRQ